MTLQRDSLGLERKALHRFVDFRDRHVLEIGCGEGRLTWLYADSARHVTAFDPDVDALRVARADCPVRLESQVALTGASARHLPFPREKFDIAILAWSL
jgi:ubiquinone/menaquinone biosynthesis C-methylase UbiE